MTVRGQQPSSGAGRLGTRFDSYHVVPGVGEPEEIAMRCADILSRSIGRLDRRGAVSSAPAPLPSTPILRLPTNLSLGLSLGERNERVM